MPESGTSETQAEPSRAAALAQDWLEHLRTERRMSALTLASYRRELDVLVQRLAGSTLERWSEADVRSAIAAAARQGLSPASIARRLSAWRGFFQWLCISRGELAVNPVKGIRGPRRARLLPKALPPDQAAALMHAGAPGRSPVAPNGKTDSDPESYSGSYSGSHTEPFSGSVALANGMPQIHQDSRVRFEAVRDQAVLELLYSSGLRLAELISLDCRQTVLPEWSSRSWLDLDEADVQVLGKGNKRRTVPVGRKAVEALQAWLQERHRYLGQWAMAEPARAAAREPGDVHALFISRRGQRLSPRAVQHLVSRRARERGVPSAVHPHVLRHSFASHVLQSSGDIRAVQELLGHASIATTQIYTALDFQRLTAVYDAAHPRARKGNS